MSMRGILLAGFVAAMVVTAAAAPPSITGLRKQPQLASGAAMRLAWPVWRPVGGAGEGSSPDIARSRFLAKTGLGLGALFSLAALATIIPMLLLGPCD